MESSTAYLPVTALRDFSLRMASHGFPVSGTMMTYDTGYALEQLRCAHAMADTGLRVLAMELFRHLEVRALAIERPSAAR